MSKRNRKNRSRKNRVVRYAINPIKQIQPLGGGGNSQGGAYGKTNSIKSVVYDDKGNKYKWDDELGDYIHWVPTGGGNAVPHFYKDYLAQKQREQAPAQSQSDLQGVYEAPEDIESSNVSNIVDQARNGIYDDETNAPEGDEELDPDDVFYTEVPDEEAKAQKEPNKAAQDVGNDKPIESEKPQEKKEEKPAERKGQWKIVGAATPTEKDVQIVSQVRRNLNLGWGDAFAKVAFALKSGKKEKALRLLQKAGLSCLDLYRRAYMAHGDGNALKHICGDNFQFETEDQVRLALQDKLNQIWNAGADEMKRVSDRLYELGRDCEGDADKESKGFQSLGSDWRGLMTEEDEETIEVPENDQSSEEAATSVGDAVDGAQVETPKEEAEDKKPVVDLAQPDEDDDFHGDVAPAWEEVEAPEPEQEEPQIKGDSNELETDEQSNLKTNDANIGTADSQGGADGKRGSLAGTDSEDDGLETSAPAEEKQRSADGGGGDPSSLNQGKTSTRWRDQFKGGYEYKLPEGAKVLSDEDDEDDFYEEDEAIDVPKNGQDREDAARELHEDLAQTDEEGDDETEALNASERDKSGTQVAQNVLNNAPDDASADGKKTGKGYYYPVILDKPSDNPELEESRKELVNAYTSIKKLRREFDRGDIKYGIRSQREEEQKAAWDQYKSLEEQMKPSLLKLRELAAEYAFNDKSKGVAENPEQKKLHDTIGLYGLYNSECSLETGADYDGYVHMALLRFDSVAEREEADSFLYAKAYNEALGLLLAGNRTFDNRNSRSYWIRTNADSFSYFRPLPKKDFREALISYDDNDNDTTLKDWNLYKLAKDRAGNGKTMFDLRNDVYQNIAKSDELSELAYQYFVNRDKQRIAELLGSANWDASETRLDVKKEIRRLKSRATRSFNIFANEYRRLEQGQFEEDGAGTNALGEFNWDAVDNLENKESSEQSGATSEEGLEALSVPESSQPADEAVVDALSGAPVEVPKEETQSSAQTPGGDAIDVPKTAVKPKKIQTRDYFETAKKRKEALGERDEHSLSPEEEQELPQYKPGDVEKTWFLGGKVCAGGKNYIEFYGKKEVIPWRRNEEGEQRFRQPRIILTVPDGKKEIEALGKALNGKGTYYPGHTLPEVEMPFTPESIVALKRHGYLPYDWEPAFIQNFFKRQTSEALDVSPTAQTSEEAATGVGDAVENAPLFDEGRELFKSFKADYSNKERLDAISAFLERASKELKKDDLKKLAYDVFGVLMRKRSTKVETRSAVVSMLTGLALTRHKSDRILGPSGWDGDQSTQTNESKAAPTRKLTFEEEALEALRNKTGNADKTASDENKAESDKALDEADGYFAFNNREYQNSVLPDELVADGDTIKTRLEFYRNTFSTWLKMASDAIDHYHKKGSFKGFSPKVKNLFVNRAGIDFSDSGKACKDLEELVDLYKRRSEETANVLESGGVLNGAYLSLDREDDSEPSTLCTSVENGVTISFPRRGSIISIDHSELWRLSSEDKAVLRSLGFTSSNDRESYERTGNLEAPCDEETVKGLLDGGFINKFVYEIITGTGESLKPLSADRERRLWDVETLEVPKNNHTSEEAAKAINRGESVAVPEGVGEDNNTLEEKIEHSPEDSERQNIGKLTFTRIDSDRIPRYDEMLDRFTVHRNRARKLREIVSEAKDYYKRNGNLDGFDPEKRAIIQENFPGRNFSRQNGESLEDFDFALDSCDFKAKEPDSYRIKEATTEGGESYYILHTPFGFTVDLFPEENKLRLNPNGDDESDGGSRKFKASSKLFKSVGLKQDKVYRGENKGKTKIDGKWFNAPQNTWSCPYSSSTLGKLEDAGVLPSYLCNVIGGYWYYRQIYLGDDYFGKSSVENSHNIDETGANYASADNQTKAQVASDNATSAQNSKEAEPQSPKQKTYDRAPLRPELAKFDSIHKKICSAWDEFKEARDKKDSNLTQRAIRSLVALLGDTLEKYPFRDAREYIGGILGGRDEKGRNALLRTVIKQIEGQVKNVFPEYKRPEEGYGEEKYFIAKPKASDRNKYVGNPVEGSPEKALFDESKRLITELEDDITNNGEKNKQKLMDAVIDKLSKAPISFQALREFANAHFRLTPSSMPGGSHRSFASFVPRSKKDLLDKVREVIEDTVVRRSLERFEAAKRRKETSTSERPLEAAKSISTDGSVSNAKEQEAVPVVPDSLSPSQPDNAPKQSAENLHNERATGGAPSNKEFCQRLQRYADAMTAMKEAAEDAARYFDEHGSFDGFDQNKQALLASKGGVDFEDLKFVRNKLTTVAQQCDKQVSSFQDSIRKHSYSMEKDYETRQGYFNVSINPRTHKIDVTKTDNSGKRVFWRPEERAKLESIGFYINGDIHRWADAAYSPDTLKRLHEAGFIPRDFYLLFADPDSLMKEYELAEQPSDNVAPVPDSPSVSQHDAAPKQSAPSDKADGTIKSSARKPSKTAVKPKKIQTRDYFETAKKRKEVLGGRDVYRLSDEERQKLPQYKSGDVRLTWTLGGSVTTGGKSSIDFDGKTKRNARGSIIDRPHITMWCQDGISAESFAKTFDGRVLRDSAVIPKVQMDFTPGTIAALKRHGYLPYDWNPPFIKRALKSIWKENPRNKGSEPPEEWYSGVYPEVGGITDRLSKTFYVSSLMGAKVIFDMCDDEIGMSFGPLFNPVAKAEIINKLEQAGFDWKYTPDNINKLRELGFFPHDWDSSEVEEYYRANEGYAKILGHDQEYVPSHLAEYEESARKQVGGKVISSKPDAQYSRASERAARLIHCDVAQRERLRSSL